MWTKDFWKALAERAISTAAETLLATVGVGTIALQAVDWPLALGIAGTAALASALKCLVVRPAEVTAKEALDSYEAKHLRREGTD
jgi:hypothetical protein